MKNVYLIFAKDSTGHEWLSHSSLISGAYTSRKAALGVIKRNGTTVVKYVVRKYTRA